MTITYKRNAKASWPEQNIEITQTAFINQFGSSVYLVARWLENLISELDEMTIYDNNGECVGGHIYAKQVKATN